MLFTIYAEPNFRVLVRVRVVSPECWAISDLLVVVDLLTPG